jgi:hypothetical protein
VRHRTILLGGGSGTGFVRPDMHLNADPYVTSYVARAAEVSVPTRTVRSVTGPGLCGLAVLIRNCVHVHSGNGMRSAGGEMVR